MFNSVRNRELNQKQFLKEEVIFRQTQIPGDIPMKRFNQQTPDFPVSHLAEKLPIHYRSNNKSKQQQIVPVSAANVHDLSHVPVDLLSNEDEDGRQSRSSLFSPKQQKPPAFLPGDRVIFAESPSAPGIPVVYRTPDERSSNPDRLNLDRRKLTVCPILEGEEQLRLLNYQHNQITKIQHLGSLKRLIFLDLYDNQIEEISGLSSLKSLRVLMLGKNKLKKIENLEALQKLDVLDLHGNQISCIENLNHLSELRVLNLAGNQITHVNGLTGMDSLAELNLRRNKIRTVEEVANLHTLQRLFLSYNDIHSFEDISCLGESTSLSEISLDGNPLTSEQYYKQIVLRHMQQLKQLDMKRVSEEERRIALVMARKEEEKKKEMNKLSVMKVYMQPFIGKTLGQKEKRRLAINNAKRQWEVMQGSLIQKTSKMTRTPELYANHIGSVPNSEVVTPDNDGEEESRDESESLTSKQSSRANSRPGSAHSMSLDGGDSRERPRTASQQQRRPEPKPSGLYKETMMFGTDNKASNLNNLADLEGDTLTLYGPPSLEALDRNWGMQAAGAVTVIIFKFIDFDEICKHLQKIRTRFPATQTLVFSSTNICSFTQLNALTSLRRLDNLMIELEGNPVTRYTLWKSYLLFRLAHFALKRINNVEVTASDVMNAEKLFGAISNLTTTQLPQTRLLSLLGETRRKQLLTMSEEKSRKILDGTVKMDKTQGEFVGRAGLTYQQDSSRLQDLQGKRTFARSYINEMTKEAIFVDRKRNELNKIWPQIFYEMVYSAVSDMSDSTSYMKKCLEDLDKS
ncbi:leucine-rich repeat-containing protein 49-like isoform X2 [Ruditapes philippinarum]|uniref:leucine-rich repeat-containing protein 49-like isoform X2 n=1 Tax=Ruditapes philippinarum TaxID=129788 RepID=UPI00295B6626|nr:leucine-rich repeat-containing protein 49-like isoform X2 [Ruditapes philippinarum]